MARKQFGIWQVGEEEYKLKLNTSAVCALEEKLGTSLINVMSEGGMPSLNVMLTITHAAMKDYNANIKRKDVDYIFDKYIELGGSQLDFFGKIFMDIYKVSGFFTEQQSDMMEEKQLEVENLM